jgi:hypothetical protein
MRLRASARVSRPAELCHETRLDVQLISVVFAFDQWLDLESLVELLRLLKAWPPAILLEENHPGEGVVALVLRSAGRHKRSLWSRGRQTGSNSVPSGSPVIQSLNASISG